ncbi:transcriptional regulator [Bacillaceae bacterium ZC4]|jgi:DNA-binding HxlR family transcriptional regulator|uniref:Transcriptional regulator n=2 Tax=Aeribacillus TaxID=1055323 RepID=A0A161W8T0_9BACI|nr:MULTISPECIES: helix-turn-helix domain-containing protein [Aeribacillus]AXI38385.1 transcriptional regulator [Bacillaceae bacterium ZC4]REJ23096.1 MAG: transcriptional regulator [Bacillaceae bacterium]ASS89109.1 transcriptional regulator [Aeribacillus pallidus]KZM56647.1 transcriptional regulator [Aeribacillus pallidus]MDR9792345.1 helix-turn-helix domain-containing protein [Aeribacillus pallidus]
MKIRYDIPCNIAQSLNIIGDRWTLLIIHEILNGNALFNEIKKALPGISSNLLSERLRYLEEEGLVQSELYSQHPPRYRYVLTQSGKDLEHVFNALIIWGSKHLKKCYKKLIDPATGDEVDIAYYSKKTGELVQNVEVISIESELQNIK